MKFTCALITAFSFVTVAFAEKSHLIEFPGFAKEYPVVSSSEKSPVDIVYVNFRDDVEMISAAAKALAEKIPSGTEYIVILGDKANILAAFMAQHKQLPWIVLVTKQIPEGAFAKSNVFQSITTPGVDKKIYISKAQAQKIKDKKVVIIDDVISTGATVKAGIEAVLKAGAKIQAVMCAFTEDKEVKELSGLPVISLTHVPIYPKDNA